MTVEFIFAIVTAVVTGILGSITGKTSIPNRFIPIQNLVIGCVAALVAVYFNLFSDIPTAIIVSLGMSFGVGGAYDLAKTKVAEKK